MIELVTKWEAFLDLEREWNALAEPFANPLLRHEYFAASAQAGDMAAELHVLVARRGGEIAAIAPLRARRLYGARRLEFICHDLQEPSGFIFSDQSALEELLDAILNLKLPLCLNRLLADEGAFPYLERHCHGRGVTVVTDGRTILRVPLTGDFASVERGISPGHRRNLGRLLRKAQGQGKVTFTAAAPTPQDVDVYLDEMFRIEASGWKGRAGSSILAAPFRAGFFRLYGRAAAQRRMLRILRMQIGGATAASRLAIAHGDSLWELKIGYDEQYRACSPGILLTHETLRWASGEGLAFHRFLGIAAEWERTWDCKAQECRTIRHYPPCVSSLSFLALEGIRALKGARAQFAPRAIGQTGAAS